jgi:hypothetical protein
MSAKVIHDKELSDGRNRRLASLDVDEVQGKVRETVGFLQALCENDPTTALAVAQMTLDALKRLFNVVGEVQVMENRPQ